MSNSLLDHWINQDIASLGFLDGLCNARTSDASSSSELAPNLSISRHEMPPTFGVMDYEKQSSTWQTKDSGQLSSGLPHWGFSMDVDSLKLDDIFQVEQSDLAQSPTLAALNCDNEPLFDLEFGDFDFDFPIVTRDVKTEPPTRETPITSRPTTTSPVKLEKADDVFLAKNEIVRNERITGKAESQSTISQSAIKSSLPLAIPGSSVRTRRRRTSVTNISVTSSVSSNDEGFGSQAEDTDVEFQQGSDSESQAYDEESLEDSPPPRRVPYRSRSMSMSSISSKGTKLGPHKKRYFWQYNIQSKGPKGPRLSVGSARLQDPHVLNDVTDPVFSMECNLDGVKHAGKARRGDGNDLTPNPRKLHSIGTELKVLNKMISELTSACDPPGNIKPKSRKEKNKLASRSCRLKKKAQHEANKLKLFGLQQEHADLIDIMKEVKDILLDYKHKNLSLRSCQQSLQMVLERKASPLVAGHSASYVNSVLEKVAAGQSVVGLDDFQS